MNIYQVLIRPIISEKGTFLQEERKYLFQVAKEANKLQVKEAVEKMFNVKVQHVNTIKVKGKPKRVGRRIVNRPDWKKAIVSLEPGHKIEFVEGI